MVSLVRGISDSPAVVGLFSSDQTERLDTSSRANLRE